MNTGWVLLAAGVLAMPALGQVPAAAPPSADQVTATRTHNQEIVARVPEAADVFVVGDDGTIKHLQSGLVCPSSFPSAEFYHALVFPSAEKGGDVGCDYRRADERGGAYAKLSIFATKAGADTTLDSAFAGYQREVAKTDANVRTLGPALKSKSQMPTDFRSEEYLVTMNQRDYTSDLIVAIKAGWVIEIRATYVGKPNEIEITKEGGPNAATVALGDRVAPFTAFFAAIGTVGK
jgi:hypothetical protein